MSAFTSLLQKIELLQKRIHDHRPFDENLNQVIQERLKIEWTYNSNAIEGNTLTLGETAFFLREGLTSEGRPLKDFLETKNHVEAIDLLESVVRGERKLTEHFIKSLHSVLLKGINFTYARGTNGQLVKKTLHIGEYKKQPNHVLTLSGDIYHYSEPLQVPVEMQQLLEWYQNTALHPVEKAALFHYRFVRIHPFDDGNGRLSRLLMNLILMKHGYPPCIVKTKNRKKYIQALERTDQTQDTNIFMTFIAQELFETMTLVINLLDDKSGTRVSFSHGLNKTERHELILSILVKPLVISQILDLLPQIKRPTLKKDLAELVQSDKIRKSGSGKGTTYMKK